MRNLLTVQTKRRLGKEYRLRVTLAVLTLAIVALFIGLVLLVPAYVLSQSRKQSVEEHTKVVEQGLERETVDLSSEELQLVQVELDLFSAFEEKELFSDRVKGILLRKPLDVEVRSISYTTEEASGGVLVLSGTADTRESLLAFRRSLESNKNFTSISLPVSDLVEERNLTFTITIKGDF